MKVTIRESKVSVSKKIFSRKIDEEAVEKMKNIWILTLSLAVIALLTVPGLAAIQPELSMAGSANFIYNPSILASTSVNSRGMPAEMALTGGIWAVSACLDFNLADMVPAGRTTGDTVIGEHGRGELPGYTYYSNPYVSNPYFSNPYPFPYFSNSYSALLSIPYTISDAKNITSISEKEKFFTANISTKNISTKDSAKNVSAKDLEISRESFPKDFSRKISAKV